MYLDKCIVEPSKSYALYTVRASYSVLAKKMQLVAALLTLQLFFFALLLT
jgi:hypothetical protein